MKVMTVITHRRGKESSVTGTIPELIEYFGYTLEVGHSYRHEKGNKKINKNPKTVKSLITNLNNAVTNSAANGCPDKYFTLG